MTVTVRILSLILLAGALLVRPKGWRRVSFAGFIALSLFSFALRAGWPARPLAPHACEGFVDTALLFHSLRNTPHIVLFAACFLLARAQFAGAVPAGAAPTWRDAAALGTALVIGALVEVAEGISGSGHCRLRDLLPDFVGAMLGWGIFLTVRAAAGRRVPSPRRVSTRTPGEHPDSP